MPANALAPGGARSSAAMILIMWNGNAPVFLDSVSIYTDIHVCKNITNKELSHWPLGDLNGILEKQFSS